MLATCSSHVNLAFISRSPRVPRTLISTLRSSRVFLVLPRTHWPGIRLVFLARSSHNDLALISCSLHALFEFNLTLKLNFSSIACPKRTARLKHGSNRYLNFPAWVCTVTENPRTPNVFLQVQNTEYLAIKSGKERVTTSKYAQQSYILCLIMGRITMPNRVPVFKSNNFVLKRINFTCCAIPKQTALPKLFSSP